MKRIWSGLAAAVIWTSAALAASAEPLFEPGTKYDVIQTAHFRIYYTPEFEGKSKQVAAIAEDAYARLVPYMQVAPSGLTEVIIADGYDELNSMAHNSPHRAVWLWMTPPNPDEGMPIGRYDHWLRLLFTHEFTHILQFEHSPWLVNQANTALGGLLLSSFPQLPIEITLNLPDLLSNAPSFFTEGLAVHTESTFTPGGRAKEGEFEMMRRMAILENRAPTYDQVQGRYLLDWPMAGYEYTWGSSFIDFLTRKYGEDAPARILKAYSSVPWLGLSVAVQRTIGVPMADVWNGMMNELTTKYTADRSAWEARKQKSNLVAPADLTVTGRYHRHPTFDANGVLYYEEALKNKGPRLWSDKLDGSERTVVMGKSTRSAASLDPTGKKIYYEADTSDTIKQLVSYRDLFVFDREAKTSTRLTKQARTFAPQVSHDGTKIVAATSGGGRSGIGVFDVKGTLLHKWTYDNNDYQFGNPVWSPDDKQVAVAVWHGGTRDLYLLDPESGHMKPLWSDAAVDFYPAWTPDGKTLLFCSDRSAGVFNLFAYDLKTRALHQLTDVEGGAFDPAISPDGKTIAFAAYSGRGYDIETMPYQPALSPKVATLALPPGEPGPVPLPPTPEFHGLGAYSPLPTLIPSVWFPILGEDEWGTNLSVYSFWQDVLRDHQLTLIGGYGFYSQRVNYGFRYEYGGGLPQWSVGMNEYPSPGRVILSQNPGQDPRFGNLWQWNKSASISFEYPGLRNPMFDPPPITGDNWTVGLHTETVEDYALIPDLKPEELAAAPYNGVAPRLTADTHYPQPFALDEGNAHSAFVQWQRANQIKYPYDYGPIDGQITSVGLESGLQIASNPAASSEVNFAPLPAGTQPFARFWADHRFYKLMPWGEKQSLAVRTTAGMVYNRNGDFFYSAWRQPFGYQPLSTVNRWDLTSATDYSNRYVMMRGYSFLAGNRALTAGAEYRVPLGEVAHGIGDVPLFLDRLYGVGFVDSGLFWGTDSRAFDLPTFSYVGAPGTIFPDMGSLKLSLGAELRAQSVIFQAVPVDIRFGVARGLTADGDFQFNWGLGTTY